MKESMETASHRPSVIYAAIAGLCLFVISIGLNRFSYTSIIPCLINHHWTTATQAGYIGSTNFLGYFVGVYMTYRLMRRFSAKTLMVITLLVLVIASTLCIFNFGFVWLSFLRLLLGFSTGTVMVLVPTVVLLGLSNKQKSIISGIMFAGIGIGTTIGSLAVPLLNHWGGMIGIWTGFAIMTGLLALVALRKCLTAADYEANQVENKGSLQRRQYRSFILDITGYSLCSIALAPSLLFLADYAHHVLGANLSISSFLFALFGICCTAGSVVSGIMYHKWGDFKSIVIVGLIGIISLLTVALFPTLIAVGISALLSGFYLIAIMVLMSLFIADLVGMENHARYWSIMSLIFAAAQFIAGYFFSYALNLNFTYIDMFWTGTVALCLSLLCYLVSRLT